MYKREAATDPIVSVYQQPSSLKHSTRDFGIWIAGFMSGKDTGLSADAGTIQALKIPVQLIWGKEDSTTPLNNGESLHAMLVNSELTVIDDAGHMPHLEQPDAFYRALVAALKKLSRHQ